MQVKAWLSAKRKRFLADTLRLHGVTQHGGELTIGLDTISDAHNHLVALGQACSRVADLQFTKRTATITTFSESVEAIIEETELPYDRDVQLLGRFAKVIRVDFLIQGPRVPSAVLGVSATTPSSAHTMVNEVFRKWYDLTERTEQRITVVDDYQNVYRDEDLRRLRDLSDIAYLSNPRELQQLVA